MSKEESTSSTEMDPAEAEVTSRVLEDFRYLLVRLGRQLHHADCEGLMYVHKIPKAGDRADVGLHTLSMMEAQGHFDPLHPDRLQDALSKIGRRDLANDIKEYKHSGTYKRAVKLENERERENKKREKIENERERENKKREKEKSKKKNNKAGAEKGVEERHVAASLLSGVKVETPPMERRWRDMFAAAFTQTAQLVEQMNLLHRTIEEYDRDEEKHRRIEDALQSLVTAQDEVDTLSRTLKKAISAAGLKSRKQSQENILDDSLDSEDIKKQPLLPSGQKHSPMLSRSNTSGRKHSPMLTRSNTYDGAYRHAVSKTVSARPPSIPLPLPLSTTATATDITTPASTAIVPPPPPPIALIPVPAPTAPSDANKSKATPSTVAPPQASPPTANKNKATPLAVVPPTAPSTANKTKPAPPAVKTKPVNKTPEFSRKLESLFAEGAPKLPTSPTFVTKSALAHANSNSPSPLTTVSKSSTLPAVSTTLEHPSQPTPLPLSPDDARDAEHVYEDPNLSREESEDMYMNSSMVVGMVGSTTQLGGSAGSSAQQGPKMKKEASTISVQTDSGLGRDEDSTWPKPELKESKDHHYQNLSEYAKPGAASTTTPTTGQYTTPDSNWGTIVHHTPHQQGAA